MSRDDLPITPPPNNDRPSDRYRCGRLCGGSGVGACPRGPSPKGVCGAPEQACRPELTFRGYRRRIVLSSILVGITALAAWSYWDARSLYKPGPLSGAHAAVFAQGSHAQGPFAEPGLTESQCAACHPNANSRWAQWFNWPSFYHNRLSQTDSCVECHHNRTPAAVARSPHNLPAERLAAIREAWSEVDSGDSAEIHHVSHPIALDHRIECATCHQEHGGIDANLTLVTNHQCQSCHSRTFTSFTHGHPDWQQWPHGAPAAIAFDHASHQHKHFTKTPGQAFDCQSCHPGNGNPLSDGLRLASHAMTGHKLVDSPGGFAGEPVRTASYEAACASCHDEALRQQAAQRLDLIALPTLTREPAQRIVPWPEPLIGFFDGDVSPLARWLIADDPKVDLALRHLPGDASFSLIDPSAKQQVVASAWVARALRRKLDQLATQGNAAIRPEGNESEPSERNQRADDAMRRILRHVPPQLLWDARLRWFDAPPGEWDSAGWIRPESGHDASPDRAIVHAGGRDPRLLARAAGWDGGRFHAGAIRQVAANDDLLGGDDLLGSDDDLLGSDDLLDTDPLTAPAGAGLLRDDGQAIGSGTTLEIPTSPVPSDRFDPAKMLPDGGWYRDDLRMAISYRGAGHADPVLQAVVELAGSLPESDPVRSGLLRSAAVASCVECHVGALSASGPQWTAQQPLIPSPKRAKFSHRPHLTIPQLSDCAHCHRTASTAEQATVSSGFQSLGKAACVSCHTASAAGDRCTQCHFYHPQP